jgi:hypothetical protein
VSVPTLVGAHTPLGHTHPASSAGTRANGRESAVGGGGVGEAWQDEHVFEGRVRMAERVSKRASGDARERDDGSELKARDKGKSPNGSSEGLSVSNWEWRSNWMHQMRRYLKPWNWKRVDVGVRSEWCWADGASGSLSQSSKAGVGERGSRVTKRRRDVIAREFVS